MSTQLLFYKLLYCKYAHLLILKSSFADNDVFNSSSVSKLFLMYSIILVYQLTGFFRQFVKGVLVYGPHSVMLQAEAIQGQVGLRTGCYNLNC